MTPGGWGAVIGAGAGGGWLLVAARVATIRRPQLAIRVLPYVRDVAHAGRASGHTPSGAEAPRSALTSVFGPALRSVADAVERVLGGSASIRRRLDRAGLDTDVHEFRVEQVIWGVIGFAVAAGLGVLRALSTSLNPVAVLLFAVAAFALGVVSRDSWLSSQVKARERQVSAEFPTIAELLALAVGAGESPVAALDRVVGRSGGELSADLARVLAAIRTGEPVAAAFDALAARTGLPLVSRFAQGIAIAMERGTPLADVLHAQAADVREAGRRDLIEVAARREVLMMVPVVFLILPITILFAFWPGLIGLHLSAP